MSDKIKKEYNNIAVYDLTFYRADDNGNELVDENGKVITYRAETDCTYLAEGLDIDDLEVVEGRAITELNFGDGFNENNSIAIIWCTQDIHSAIDDMDLDWTPTKEQSLEILSWIKNKHDASIGVSWETLYIYIQTFYDDLEVVEDER